MRFLEGICLHRKKGRVSSLLSFVFFFEASVSLQADDGTEKKTYDLTRFEINALEDQGYQATSTLAGTRLRMKLDDVGTAVSVYTEELMQDLAAEDNETLLAYGLATEVGGLRGNFVNPDSEGNLRNENFLNPQSNNRIRGLAQADTTRNFFKSDVPWDGYNTYRIDVQRGPNSILFGLGSPAGIINSSTRTAVFFDENRIQFRVDSEGSLRTSASFNREIFEGQLAFRVDLLRDRHEYHQDPAFEDDDRVHLAVTYKPERLNTGTTRTSFSANFEKGSIKANRSDLVAPLDYISPFFTPADENGFQGADFANGGIYGPSNSIFGPGGRTFNPVEEGEALLSIPWLSRGTSHHPVFRFDALQPGSFSLNEEGLNNKGSFLVVPNPGYNEEDPESELGMVVINDGVFVHPYRGNTIQGVQNHLFQYQGLSTGGKARIAELTSMGFPGFWRDSSFSSTEHYDFMDNLLSGGNKREQQDFEVLDLQFRNTFFYDRMGYQLSYFKQEMDSRQDGLGAQGIGVEVHSLDTLSDDPYNPVANPNAGRVFVEMEQGGGFEDIRNREATQAQLFATLDTEDFWDNSLITYLFGRHEFAGLLKNRKLEQYRRQFQRFGVDEETYRTFGTGLSDDPDLDPGPGARATLLRDFYGNYQPRIWLYLDAQGPGLTHIQPFADSVVSSGTYTMGGFVTDPEDGFATGNALAHWIAPDGRELWQADNPANYVGTVADKGEITIVHASDSPEALEYLTYKRFFDSEDIDSKSLVWTGTFLDGALVGVYGWREDQVMQGSLEHTFSKTSDSSVAGRTGGPVFDPRSSFVHLSEGEFQSRNWSVKLNVSQFFFDLMRMEDTLPFDIALLYNEGEVQNPQPGRRDILLKNLAPATGSTIDRSLAISTKDGRFSLRITDYETVQRNANAGNAAGGSNFWIEQSLNWGALGVWSIETRFGPWSRNPALNNGDGVDDPDELGPSLSQRIRETGFDDAFGWGDSVAQAYRDFRQKLSTRWPTSDLWISDTHPQTNEPLINFPDDTVFVEDNTSFGTEFEFTARPVDNWNIRISASKTEALRSKVYGDQVRELIDFITDEVTGLPGQIPVLTPNGGNFFRWPGDDSEFLAGTRALPFIAQLVTNRALLGTPTGELRKWKANIVSSYGFRAGFLSGIGIGAGVRYENSQVIGFPPIYVDPVTGERLTGRRADEAITVDLDNPYRDDSRTTADLWLNYRRKLNDKIDWRIQLNVFNVFDDEGTVPLWINPDGTVGTRGIRFGRSWSLTNTFEF